MAVSHPTGEAGSAPANGTTPSSPREEQGVTRAAKTPWILEALQYALSGGVADKGRKAVASTIDLMFGVMAGVVTYVVLTVLRLKPPPRDKNGRAAEENEQ
jgi:hypothetical protein